MIHFNRKTEYAILAVEHMARKGDSSITSTREVADAYHIPYPLLAKVLQKLAAKGTIKAVHGTKGGYVLAKRPSDISIADVVEIFDGPVAVAECFREEKITCPQWDGCHIKDPFYELNTKIHDLLAQTKITDLTRTHERIYGIEPAPSR
jgi:Rrf2 family protein